jgi:hypothetical protein
MNDDDIKSVLRLEEPAARTLDPATVIAGAHRRRRIRGVAVGAVASAAVAAVVTMGIIAGSNGAGQEPFGPPPVAGSPSQSATPSSDYRFQNSEPQVGTLPAGTEAKIGRYHYFKTRGTQWAVISRVPGEPEIEPFGWRATVGNDNLGDERSLGGMQIAGLVYSSVYKSDKASKVVYVRGDKAWYGKIYRLAGIPGWVELSVELPKDKSATSMVTPGPPVQDVSMFVYDQNGTLIDQYPGKAGNPLPR